jgi:creatinine amidohydrolase
MASRLGSSFLYGDLTFDEIRERAEAGCLAIVATGCTEQQGPHLPVDFDTWFVEALMVAAAERAFEKYEVSCLVLPVMPFGPTLEHRGYGAGYIHVPAELHGRLVSSVLDSLAEQGFRKMVLWRGCGGHKLQDVVEEFNREHREVARAFLPAQPYHAVWCRVGDPKVPGGHADSYATSIALHLRPAAVRAERITRTSQLRVEWDSPALDFTEYSSTGVIGDPTHASSELGARLWGETVEAVAGVLAEVAALG